MNVRIPHYSYMRHHTIEDALPTPPPITQESFDTALKFKPETGDVIVASYPKSGTTWTMNILYLMKNHGVPLVDDHIHKHIPFMERWDEKEMQERASPRIIKTHLNWSLIPFNKEAKYVYVVRNPKDNVISSYYHHVGLKCFNYEDGKFDDFFELYISGRSMYGDYYDVVPKWFDASKNHSNICLLLYEDLKTNPRKEILKIAEFLGEDMKETLLKNEEKILKDVVKHSSFSAMKMKNGNFVPGILKLYPGFVPAVADDFNIKAMECRSREKTMFIRKGEIGDWRNHLSQEQSKRMDRKMKESNQKHPGFGELWRKYNHLFN